MDVEIAAPVKVLINAFNRGAVLVKRICRAAPNGPSYLLRDTIAQGQILEMSLVKSSDRVRDACTMSMKTFGKQFTEAIYNDHETTNKLQSLAIYFQDQINSLDEYMDNPQAFDLGSLTYLLRETERCCEEAEKALGTLHQRLLRSYLQQDKTPVRDEQSQPLHIRQARPGSITSQVSPMSRTPPDNLIEAHTTRDTDARPRSVAEGPTRYHGASEAPSNIEFSTSVSVETLKETRKVSEVSRAALEKTNLEVKSTERKWSPGVSIYELIGSKDEVEMPRPLNILKKGKISEMDGLRPIREDAPSYEAMVTKKPELGSQTEKPLPPPPCEDLQNRSSVYSTASLSPISNRASYGLTSFSAVSAATPDTSGSVILERDGSNNLSTHGSTSSLGKNSTNISRIGSERSKRDSEVLAFAPPDSPPLSQGQQSSTNEWRNPNFVGRIRAPNSDEIAEGGLEVVGQTLVSDPGLILTKEDQPEPEPTITATMQPLGHPMRHDASFFKYGGFCDGAKLMQKGVGGALKVVKKPGGHYTALVSMKCVGCSYEVGFNVYERDVSLDRTGIYTPAGMQNIRFRQRFLSKSHVASRHTDESFYACLFCVEENRTVEEYDATVFFSVHRYFRHLQEHPRPLRPVDGITVVYGQNTDSPDFDIQFLNMTPLESPFGGVTAELASRPIAQAIRNHHKHAKGFKGLDPEDRPTLQFAIGAQIAGLTFPPRFNGAWACGYHDNENALFPASTIQLHPPRNKDVSMNPKSTCSATAKWDHKPKDTTSGWLIFSKKEKIFHIGFPYPDYWCWSGMNAKGKWGLFPKDFVDGVTDIGGGGGSMRGAGRAMMNYLPELDTGNIIGSVNHDSLSSATSAPCSFCEGIPGSRESSYTNSPSHTHYRSLSSGLSNAPSLPMSYRSNSPAGTPTERQEPTQRSTHERSSSTSSWKIERPTSGSSFSSLRRRLGMTGGGYPSGSDSGVTPLKRDDDLLSFI